MLTGKPLCSNSMNSSHSIQFNIEVVTYLVHLEEASSVLVETLAFSSMEEVVEDHTLTWPEEEEEALHPCRLAQMSRDGHPFLKTENER